MRLLEAEHELKNSWIQEKPMFELLDFFMFNYSTMGKEWFVKELRLQVC